MEHLHLFTPVSEGLPEEGQPVYLLADGNRIFSGILKEGKFRCLAQHAESLEDADDVTHWLDLSKLTTKVREEKLIDACRTVKEGYEDDGMKNMQERDYVFYEQCIKALDF